MYYLSGITNSEGESVFAPHASPTTTIDGEALPSQFDDIYKPTKRSLGPLTLEGKFTRASIFNNLKAASNYPIIANGVTTYDSFVPQVGEYFKVIYLGPLKTVIKNDNTYLSEGKLYGKYINDTAYYSAYFSQHGLLNQLHCEYDDIDIYLPSKAADGTKMKYITGFDVWAHRMKFTYAKDADVRCVMRSLYNTSTNMDFEFIMDCTYHPNVIPVSDSEYSFSTECTHTFSLKNYAIRPNAFSRYANTGAGVSNINLVFKNCTFTAFNRPQLSPNFKSITVIDEFGRTVTSMPAKYLVNGVPYKADFQYFFPSAKISCEGLDPCWYWPQ